MLKELKEKAKEFIDIAFKGKKQAKITLIDECTGEEFTPDLISYDRYPDGNVIVRITFNS